MAFEVEREFTLPRGFLDEEGALHKVGVMRLATAGDEILPQKDPRVQANPAYLPVIVLSRVITKLGDLSDINPRVVERLFASDVAFLEALYEELNGGGALAVGATCPKCEHEFEVALDLTGEA